MGLQEGLATYSCTREGMGGHGGHENAQILAMKMKGSDLSLHLASDNSAHPLLMHMRL